MYNDLKNVPYDAIEFIEVNLGGGYDFDIFAVWRYDGQYFWGTDAGCSCPTPFENTDWMDLSRGPAEAALNDYVSWYEKTNQYSNELCRDTYAYKTLKAETLREWNGV